MMRISIESSVVKKARNGLFYLQQIIALTL